MLWRLRREQRDGALAIWLKKLNCNRNDKVRPRVHNGKDEHDTKWTLLSSKKQYAQSLEEDQGGEDSGKEG